MRSNNEAQLALELTKIAGQLPSDPADNQHLQTIDQFSALARLATELQAQAVRAAHDAGLSWAKIGQHLGISRQAVQQRFDPSYQAVADNELRILGPVTRDEELTHLNAAAKEGWYPVRSLPNQHHMRYDGHPREIRRVSLLSPARLPSEKSGWQAATIRFPDAFYMRETNGKL